MFGVVHREPSTTCSDRMRGLVKGWLCLARAAGEGCSSSSGWGAAPLWVAVGVGFGSRWLVMARCCSQRMYLCKCTWCLLLFLARWQRCVLSAVRLYSVGPDRGALWGGIKEESELKSTASYPQHQPKPLLFWRPLCPFCWDRSSAASEPCSLPNWSLWWQLCCVQTVPCCEEAARWLTQTRCLGCRSWSARG